jgi:hypothetical protein
MRRAPSTATASRASCASPARMASRVPTARSCASCRARAVRVANVARPSSRARATEFVRRRDPQRPTSWLLAARRCCRSVSTVTRMLDLRAPQLLSMALLAAAIGCSVGSSHSGTGGAGHGGGGGGGVSGGAGSSSTAGVGGGGGGGGALCVAQTGFACRQGVPGPGGICGDAVRSPTCVYPFLVCPDGWFPESLCGCIGPPPADAAAGWCHAPSLPDAGDAADAHASDVASTDDADAAVDTTGDGS